MKNYNIILFILVFLAGCATTEKKAKKYYMDNKDQLAELCADCFPVKTTFKPGKPIELPRDTIYKPGIPVIVRADCPDGTTIEIPVDSKDTVVVYVPVMIRDTLELLDSAAMYKIQSDLKKVNEANLKLEIEKAAIKSEKNNWRKWCLILGGVVLLSIIVFFFKIYSRGIIPKG